MFATSLRQKGGNMEFPEDEKKEKEESVDAHVCSSRKINAITTYIYSTYELGVLRDEFYEVANRKSDGDDPYSQLGKALFAMNVEAVQQSCAKFPSLRLRGRVMPNYKYRKEKASLVRVYDAVKDLQDQCWILSGTDLFELLCTLRQAVADDIIETNRELLAEEKVGRA
jgi:hypothetical protein